MFARLVKESFVRNPRRKLLTAAALVVGMAVTTATLTIALEVGDRLAREFRSLGANLLVTPESDTLPVEIGGVDYRPVDEGAYLKEADLGKLKTIFWRHNILGFTPFLDVPARIIPIHPIQLRVRDCDRHMVRTRRARPGWNDFQDWRERDASLVADSGAVVRRSNRRMRCGRSFGTQLSWRDNARAVNQCRTVPGRTRWRYRGPGR